MYKQLSSEQRYAIFVLLQRKTKKKEIAKAIGVSPSTITRELQRNSSSKGVYNPTKAQASATIRKQRMSASRTFSSEVRKLVKWLLVNTQWSPEQISGVFRSSLAINVSHETIYRMIRMDKKQGGTLYTHLRHRLKHRKRYVGASGTQRIKNRVSISQRPQEADGTRFGDFEMDTIVGANNKDAILTIVERKTNMLFMEKLPHGKNATQLANAVVKLLQPYKHIIKTITTDNGSEFAAHEIITQQLGAKVYFADPYASWQKPAIENANGLIRQYIPKGQPLNGFSKQQIIDIMNKINTRPRKKLNYYTPKQCFIQFLH